MDAKHVLAEFLARYPVSEPNSDRARMLSSAFADLDAVLKFEELSENDLSDFFNFAAGIKSSVVYPTKKSRAKFFSSVKLAASSLRRLAPSNHDWFPLSQSVLDQILELESELTSILEAQKTWGRGRFESSGKAQEFAIQQINRILNQSKKSSPERWRHRRIQQLGQFTRQIRSADQLFKITPARLISNLAKALDVDLSESAVQFILKKRLHPASTKRPVR